MATPFKMKGFQAYSGSPILKNSSFDHNSPVKAPIIGKRVVNPDGSVSRTFTNPFTGRTSTRTVRKGASAAATHNMMASGKQTGKERTYDEKIMKRKDVVWEHKDKAGKTLRKTTKHRDVGESGKVYINKWGKKKFGKEFDKYSTKEKENIFNRMRGKTKHEGTIHSDMSRKTFVDKKGKPVDKPTRMQTAEEMRNKQLGTGKVSKSGKYTRADLKKFPPGHPERKKVYDALNWEYDNTIK